KVGSYYPSWWTTSAGALQQHEGMIVPVTGLRNHFPTEEATKMRRLFGDGIGDTSIIAVADPQW
ncbi:MAG: hypothetical protein ACOH2H_25915, partial [Cypionkella sp.]